jgi:ankyrin repeat protein
MILTFIPVWLLAAAGPSVADRSGLGTLSRAVINGDYAKVQRMLRANPSLARTRDFGPGQRHMRATPLHWAATTRRARMARILCSYGANPNAQDIAGQTPLHYAAAMNAVGVVRVLLAWRANPNIRDINGRTPMFQARRVGAAGVIALLSAAGGH